VKETLLITVSRSIGKLRDPAAFPRWVYQILHRRGVDFLRKNARVSQNGRRVRELEEKPADEGIIASTIDIRNALRHLSRDSYQVIHLHYLRGFSLKEIACITWIPVGTVKSSLHAARNNMRQILGGKLP
jgi:RNA polymerase sigma-70 factor (ECF subfamily)